MAHAQLLRQRERNTALAEVCLAVAAWLRDLEGEKMQGEIGPSQGGLRSAIGPTAGLRAAAAPDIPVSHWCR